MAAAPAKFKSAECNMNSLQQRHRPGHECFLMSSNGVKDYKSTILTFCLALVWLRELGHPFTGSFPSLGWR